jgi:fibronectin-binding autotransporter adhesin
LLSQTCDVNAQQNQTRTIHYIRTMKSNSILSQAFRLLIPMRPLLVALCAGVASSAHAATTLTNTFNTLGTNTWTVPPGVTSVDVYCWGGGGGSGSGRSYGTVNSARVSGGGGAGGSFASTTAISVTPGNVINIFVGAGGTAGAAGDLGAFAGAGAGSWFATPATVFAQGGGGGQNAVATNSPGIGGSGSSASSIGAIVQAGGNGGNAPGGGGGGGGGSAGDLSAGGNASGSAAGTAGSGSSDLTAGVAGTGGRTGTNPGNPGNPPGGGAGGARPANVAGDTQAGGVGGPGRVVLVYTTPFNALTWLGDGVNNRWTTNAGNNVWDSNGDFTADADFVNLDLVTFDANGAANSTVNIDSIVEPTTATVNSGSAYTFTGSGKISGSAALTKDGFGDLTVSLPNDYTGDTSLADGNLFVGANNALGAGKIIFNRPDGLGFTTLAPDGATDRTLPNGLWFRYGNGVNINKLGDATKAGRLTVNGAVDFGGGARLITVNGLVTFAGGTTNYTALTAANGRFTKEGPGELTLTGATPFIMTGAADILNGTVIIDSVSVTNGDRVITDAPAGIIARLVITNGGSLTVNNVFSNLRSGRAATAPAGTNIVDIAGLVRMDTANEANGYAYLYPGAVHAEMNFLTGGDFTARGVTSSGTGDGNTVFNFNGGMLRARQNNGAFITGLSNVVIQAGGAFIDAQGFAIEIPQAMSGPGSLTKSGTGSLTLSGSNTFAGAVTVAAGKVFFTSAHQGIGGAVNTAGGTVGFLSTSAGNTAGISSVTQTGGSLEASFTDQSGVPSAVAGYITNLTASGTVAINVGALPGVTSSATIPLLTYGSLSGSPTFILGTTPKGYLGTLSQIGNTFFFNLTNIVPLIWAGAPTNTWDINTSTNWTLLGNPDTYADGGNVLFNDTAAAPEVQLVASVSPLSMLVTNNTLAYHFMNAGGGIFGDTSLTKAGTNFMRLGGVNSYSGSTTVKGGTLVLDSATALGSSNGVTVVENGASVDFNNQDITSGEEIRIAGAGVGGAGAWQNSTGNGVNRNGGAKLVLTADATIGVGTGGRSGITGTNGQMITSGGNWTLTKVGPGQFDTEGATVNLGDVLVQEGAFQTAGQCSWNTGFSIIVNSGAEFRTFRLSNPFDRPIILNNATFNNTGFQAGENNFGSTITLNTQGTFLVTPAGGQVSLNGVVQGTGDLIKNNVGRVILNAVNTYSGTTAVSNGTLQLGAAGSINNSSAYTVAAPGILDVSAPGPFTVGVGKLLSGDGTVTGDVTVNGVLAPGFSAGTLTFNGALALAGGANLQVGKFSSVLTNDQAAVSGALTLGGALNVSLLPGTETLAVNDEFTLFSAGGGFSGAFSSTNLPSGYTWDTSTLGIDGKIKVLTVAPTIPTTPTNIVFNVSGGNINLSWPASYLGWSLQAQTNTLASGLGTAWVTIPGTELVTSTNIAINPGNGAVFFRMYYQTP